MNQPHHLTQEADIGSGERSPGQHETDKMIEQVSDDKSSVPADALNKAGRTDKNNANAQSDNPP